MQGTALHRGDTVRIRDERWTVTSISRQTTDFAILAVQGCDRSNRGTCTRYVLPFEPVERLPVVQTAKVVSARRWRHLARATLARAMPMPDALLAAATADIAILPYQLEPALAVVRGAAARILIADEVGLGKTIEAGLIVAETFARRADAHVIVICPAGLRQQWREELASRFNLTAELLDAASVRRFAAGDGANPWALCPLIVTSIDYIKRAEVMRSLEPLFWDLTVIDEAHGIAGESDRHSAATLIAGRARVSVLLTATPHSGDERAFAKLTASGDIDGSFPLLVYRRTRNDVAVETRRRTHWLHLRPTAVEAQMHAALMSYVRKVWRRSASRAARLAMIVLTRRACSSATSLARSLERRLAWLSEWQMDEGQLSLPLGNALDDDEPGAELGAPGLENVNAERTMIAAVLELARQASARQCKLEAIERLLRRTRDAAIVFTEYRDTLVVLESKLARFATCHLHGGLTYAERIESLRLFASGERRVLLATDAASEGLNLQSRCRLVVHLEVPWTPTRIEQRVGRVDRIGQKRTVHQIHLVTRQSVEEERIADLVKRSSRVSSALQALTTDTDDETAAAWVIDGEPLPDRSNDPRSDGLFTIDLRNQAASEADRLLDQRRLVLQEAAAPAPEMCSRPFVAATRRPESRRTLAAFWIELLDRDGRLLWDCLTGVEAPAMDVRSRRAADLRQSFEQRSAHLGQTMAAVQHALATRLAAFHENASRVSVQREQAIARHLSVLHARMAAPLLQHGLFDRRVEREAAVQRELLERALAASNERLLALMSLQSVTAGEIRAAFSLFMW